MLWLERNFLLRKLKQYFHVSKSVCTAGRQTPDTTRIRWCLQFEITSLFYFTRPHHNSTTLHHCLSPLQKPTREPYSWPFCCGLSNGPKQKNWNWCHMIGLKIVIDSEVLVREGHTEDIGNVRNLFVHPKTDCNLYNTRIYRMAQRKIQNKNFVASWQTTTSLSL